MSDVDDHLGGVDDADAAPPPKPPPPDRPLRGIALIVLSTVFLGSADAMGKYLAAGSLPIIEITWLRYATLFVILIGLMMWTGPRAVLRTDQLGYQVLRGVTLVLSVVLFVWALRFVPLADAAAIGFSSPLIVTVLSVIILGEVVGWRRWAATIVGFLGVMMVARPGSVTFHPALILAALGAVAWAIGMILTRKIGGKTSAISILAYTCFVGFALLTLLLPFNWITPTPVHVLVGVCAGVSNAIGHWIIVAAYRQGDASVLAPYTYVQLVIATLIGFAVFGEIPAVWSIIGIAVIIGSGIYSARLLRAPKQRT